MHPSGNANCKDEHQSWLVGRLQGAPNVTMCRATAYYAGRQPVIAAVKFIDDGLKPNNGLRCNGF